MMTSTSFKNKLNKILIGLFWILLWQIGSVLIAEEILLPSPLLVFKEIASLLKSSNFYISLLLSLIKIFIGFLASIIGGIIFAYISYRNKIFYEFINPLILIFRSVPLASIVIFLLFWIDSDNLSIYVAFIMAMPLIYTSTYVGFKGIDPDILTMAKLYEVSELKRIRYIYRIKLRDFISYSIISVSGLVLKAGISAELIGLAQNSIGKNLYNAKVYLDMVNLFAWTIVILTISMVFEKLLKKFFGEAND